MKKLFLTMCFISACLAVFGQGIPSPSTPRIMIDSDGTLMDALNPLPVDAAVSIGSVTVSVFPVFADSSGNPATATVDLTNRSIVNIGSETIGLVGAVNAVATEVSSPAEWKQQTINLTAGVAQDITTGIVGSRKFIIVKSQDTSKQFWLSVDGAAVSGTNGVLVQDWVRLEAPETIVISVISSETLALSVIEAGY